MPSASKKLRRPQRRELVLRSATAEFARTGYFGTSTATIAKNAGISQGYVVQLFGSKEALFLECIRRAGDASLARLRLLHSGNPDEAASGAGPGQTDMLLLLKAFAAASVPAVGTAVRGLLAGTHELLLSMPDMTADQARDHLAHGLLLNTLLAVGLHEHTEEHPGARALLDAALDPLPPGVSLDGIRAPGEA